MLQAVECYPHYKANILLTVLSRHFNRNTNLQKKFYFTAFFVLSILT